MAVTCPSCPPRLQMRTPGHLVAVAQGKPDTGHGCPDSGQMDAVVRVSRDNGVTWGRQAMARALG